MRKVDVNLVQGVPSGVLEKSGDQGLHRKRLIGCNSISPIVHHDAKLKWSDISLSQLRSEELLEDSKDAAPFLVENLMYQVRFGIDMCRLDFCFDPPGSVAFRCVSRYDHAFLRVS